jgi:hypothetical protein
METTTYSIPVDKEPVAVVKPPLKKPIEFVRFIDTNKHSDLEGVATNTKCLPCDWNHLRLVIKGDNHEYDVIAAWDDNDTNTPALYFGYWNDGVVKSE